MTDRVAFNMGIAAAIAVALCALALAEHTAAQSQCPAGTVPATAADIPAMQAAGIPNPTVGMCWSPSSPTVGLATAQAKQDLQSMSCNSSVNIQGLDANFAVCADTFMKALRQVNPGACINSAYRSAQQQLAACMSICGQSSCPGTCASPGNSYHQKGLAIDVSKISNNQQAWQIAISSTNGGISNPTGLHGSDPDHFQASSNACSGAPVPQSNQSDYYPTNLSSTQISQAVIGTGSSIPSGYCLVSSQPIIYMPCGTTISQQPLPAQPIATQSAIQPQTTPLTSYATTPAQPTVTTPTTSQTSPITTQSSATGTSTSISLLPMASSIPTSLSSALTSFTTATSVTISAPSSVSGLSLTGTSSPIGTLSSLLQSQPVGLPLASDATSALLFLQQITSPGAARSGEAAIQNFTSPTSSIYTIIQGDLSTQMNNDSAATTVPGTTETFGYTQQAFSQPGSTTPYTSPFSQILSGLRSALVTLLGYL